MIYAHAMPQPSPSRSGTHASSGARLVATDGRALPLRSAHLEAEAGGGLCRVVLTQRFVNPHAEPLHVTYLLPLPADGAVSGFSFTLGERRVVGEVDTRAQARERFEAAMARGQTAALVEQDRSALFTQEVGNVPPGDEIVCELVIDQPLRWLEEGAWEWRFPTVVGPRYMSAPSVVSDAPKITVDVASHGVGARSSLALRIGDATTGPVESASHAARESVEDGRREVRFGGAKLDRDVVVRWPVAALAPGAEVQLARPAGEGHDGATYGLVTLVPPREATASQPRDLTLLLDISGSMAGRPLDQLKRVSLALIEALGPDDRLELIAFGSRPTRFRPEPIRASRDGKAAARKWLGDLRASGGTEMHAAVLEALRPLREGAQRQVVLMTDGFIGFEADIVSALLDRLPAGARLHTVGVGSAPNRSLTQAAARAGRGAELIVGLEEDAERAVHRLLARTSAPLVTELTIEGAASVAPRQLPDLFAGCPTLVSLELAPGATEITIRGRGVSGPFEARLDAPPLDLGEGPQAVVTRFGRERVEDLETELTATHDRARLDREIERAGLRFQIATRLTSWIAVTEEVTVKAPARHEAMPHELPEGVSAEGLGLRPASAVTDADRRVLDQLEQQRGAPFAPAKRARLERELAQQRQTPATMTQTGTIKSELADAFFESMRGGEAEDDDGPTISAAAPIPLTDTEEASASARFDGGLAADDALGDAEEETSALIPRSPSLESPTPAKAKARRAGAAPPAQSRPAPAPAPPPVGPSSTDLGGRDGGAAASPPSGFGGAAGRPLAEPVAAHEPPSSEAAAGPPHQVPRHPALPARPKASSRAWIVVALLVALILAALATWWLTRPAAPPVEPAPAPTTEAPAGG